MQKFLLSVAVLCGITFTSFAQNSGVHTPKTSLGVELGLPIGSYSDTYSVVLGGSLKTELPVASSTMFTLSGGYTALLYTSVVKDELRSIGYNKSSEGYVPLKAGIKTYFESGFYLEGQLGAAIITESGGRNSFIYSPGIGYYAKSGFDIGVRYEAWNNNGNTFGQMSLRLAGSF